MHKKSKLLKRIIYLILILLAVFIAFCIYLYIKISSFGPLLSYYPQLTGYPIGKTNYLLLIQNNEEIRPTGGFISAYGILTFQNGLIKNLEIHDSYDKINDIKAPAPYPLDILLAGPTYPGHGFRDANFDPDFSVSALELENFFVKAYPDIKLDGVVAVNFKVIEDLLAIVGPVNVDSVSFTKDTIFANLEEKVSNVDLHDTTSLNNRKDILKKFVKNLMLKLPFNINKMPKFRKFLEKELMEKQILIVHKNPEINNILAKLGWNGEMKRRAGDYLSIVETNLGGMKSDRYIKRDVKYVVDITDALNEDGSRKATATLELRMSHNGADNIPLSGWYQSLIRSYSPSYSVLKKISVTDGNGKSITIRDNRSIPEPYIESRSDLVGFGARIIMMPDEERIIKIQYELPANTVSDNLYTLHLRKQPGTDADYYEIIVKVPQGRRLQSSTFQVKEDRAFYQTFLNEDKDLILNIGTDIDPPRIVGQEISSPNYILVRFNEPIMQDEPYFISIEDMDKKNSAHDNITVKDLEFPNERTLVIKTEGMTNQQGEFYSISLEGIRDRYGNLINPNPRVITGVLRGK